MGEGKGRRLCCIRPPGSSSQFGFGEQFANSPTNAILILALEPSPRNEPLHRVEQRQPILQRWFLQGLPLFEAALAKRIATRSLRVARKPAAARLPASCVSN